MLGFGALGEFALGEGPFAQTLPVGSQWSAPVRKAGLAVAVVATTFAGFVPQPPAQAAPVFAKFSEPQRKPVIQIGFTNAPQPSLFQPYVFGAFSQPLFSKSPLADEQPSALFEVLPPIAPPFTGFCPFEGIIKAKFNVALHSTRWWQPITLPVDTHDGVWVKKKRKRQGPDPIDLELAEKASRRAALELAVYGPAPSIPKQITPKKPVINSPPDVTELAQVIMAAREAQRQRIRAQEMADEEDDLESILKDIL